MALSSQSINVCHIYLHEEQEMSFFASNRAIAALGVGVVLYRRRMMRDDVEAKSGFYGNM